MYPFVERILPILLWSMFWFVLTFGVGYTMAKGRPPRFHWRRPFIR